MGVRCFNANILVLPSCICASPRYTELNVPDAVTIKLIVRTNPGMSLINYWINPEEKLIFSHSTQVYGYSGTFSNFVNDVEDLV